jgi:hypothetical protein
MEKMTNSLLNHVGSANSITRILIIRKYMWHWNMCIHLKPFQGGDLS